MEYVKFLDICENQTRLGTKIFVPDYLIEGKYPIIDQSQKYICGYSNDDSGLYKDCPFIIFGDVTRVFKYIDFPAYLGADGSVIIKVIDKNYDTKYVYYALLNSYIPNTGFNRHFKFVKLLKIPSYDLNKQQEIVSILDKINAIIDADKKQLELLDETVKSRFIEMFEGKSYPILKWNDVFNTKTGKLDSNAMVEGGQYPFFTCAKEIFAIDKYAFDQEALLLAGNNAAGKYDVKYYKGKFNAYQRTYVLDLKQNWSYQLFKYQLEDKLEWLREQSKGCNTRYITLKILAELEFVIPPIELQNEFESFVKLIDKSKFNIQQHLNLMQELLDKKMDEFFGE